ncbi:hypothetical protein QFZ77_007630 [Paenibacillus sp. V4I3]|uniref:sacsin N-terminal ATP-binding-like domain-containing protein n=1 Tax=Paenibacillus sp. V4I3 TaxID=3042305 RepID=UPI00278834CA|nr:hypothetical protein [Paenibacillus sp. V4I3]MDQ0878971.1 hypothetical protein [Paenibacillus sp. V4I3]
MDNNFAAQRKQLLEDIKQGEPGSETLKKLAYLRESFDSAIQDYMNSLTILSDTTYQDRKHFLLELIQNADDSQFATEPAQLTFIINNESIELRYNEIGFTVDDVIAITGTGASTKANKKIGSKSFIGEKGIGFKSVFALASSVEIESFPWHFRLHKNNVIVPEVVDTIGELKQGEGTRIRVNFTDLESIEIVAKELKRFAEGQVESFLFLQKIARFVVQDRRQQTFTQNTIQISPPTRAGKHLSIEPSNETNRHYIIYEEEVEFSPQLVSERWERLGNITQPLKRRIAAAAILGETEANSYGRMFCYLPTEVKLPVPIFLQIDGHTKADRERLHDPEQNKWNKHLIQQIPDFLLNAILDWREESEISQCLLNYIPVDPGTDQLASVFEILIEKLKVAPWVYTIEDEWVSPKNSIIANKFWAHWIEVDPVLKSQIEVFLGKKFVKTLWLEDKTWKNKLTHYGVTEITNLESAKILANVSLPEIMYKEENLISVFKEINSILSTRYLSYEVIETLKSAPIFPLEGGEFGAISKSFLSKTYWVSGRTRRTTGLEGSMDLQVINPNYTYTAIINSESQQRNEEADRINQRNEVVKEMLRKFSVPELNDDTLLSDLQIPWLLTGNGKSIEQTAKVLYAIYEVFKAKRTYDEEYLLRLSTLASCKVQTISGGICSIDATILPDALRLHSEDFLYVLSSLEVLQVPDIFKKELIDKDDQKSLRDYFIACGVNAGPKFKYYNRKYNNITEFKINDDPRYRKWHVFTKGDYTLHNNIEITVVELDLATKELLYSSKCDLKLMSEALYKEWRKETEKSIDSNITSLFFRNKPLAGYFQSAYKRFERRTPVIKDLHWAGLKASDVPLKTICGDMTNSDYAIRIKAKFRHVFKIASKYLPFVVEDSFSALDGYHHVYLDSLGILEPKVEDLNNLWERLQENQYSEMILVALEFLEAGVDIANFMLYDFQDQKLRPISEFRLGSNFDLELPLIEKNYGDNGRVLGEKLGLSVENETTPYIHIVDQLLNTSNDVQGKLILLGKLLRGWFNLEHNVKFEIQSHLRNSLYNDREPILVINDSSLFKKIQQTGITVWELQIDEKDSYPYEQAARELGLKLPLDVGKLHSENESGLTEAENVIFVDYCSQFIEGLEKNEVLRLYSKMSRFGTYPVWSNKIRKVDSLYRSIADICRVDIPLPYLDTRKNLMYVNSGDSVAVILSWMLSLNDFTTFKSASREIKDYIVKKVTESKEKKETVSSIAEDIKSSLTDKNEPFQNTNHQGWKVGLDQNQEEAVRQKISIELTRALEEEPSKIEQQMKNTVMKRNVQQKIKFVDQKASDPKAFLFAEYDGKCQVCNTRLALSNGKAWFETYRIKEANGEDIWWVDRPFNILCFCPNCHALAKHGGGLDLSNIFVEAQDLIKGETFAVEVPEHSGDFYQIKIKLNGVDKSMTISKLHLNYFGALLEAVLEGAATSESLD